ncbi:putative exo-beta-1,3-glucanase [Bimuria novae-zelandiae CBS 107.79]|uniref:Putative exo-beta-1,3-glucanase n=1 Tax=Bimuria novae-zelandiae CBS 107.79 TaxID=1447943 RepID=A0A6A5UPH7_9PLEO|nr:putative exo-beta-1,3-glucanase [Bimuria novae-zelandiae CBS 107.79]
MFAPHLVNYSTIATGPGAVNHNASYDPSDITPAKPVRVANAKIQAAAACSGPVTSNPTGFWMDQQDHTGNARGFAPFLGNFFTYQTWRNVQSYGARGDGSGDQTEAIQNALNDDSRGGTRYQGPLGAQPAHVFIPSGTYQLGSKLDLRKGTIIMGDPNNPPVLKAAPGFSGDTLIDGHDFASAPETNFMIQLRNVIIDTTSVLASKKLVALTWGIAQGCALGNVKINMPSSSTGHTGILIAGGSTIAVTDIQITGGVIGIQNSNQQVVFKNIYFKFCTTAYVATGGFNSLLQGVTFDTCGVGIDITGNSGQHGDVILLDSESKNSGNTIVFRDSSNDSGNRNNQVVIQNLKHDTTNPIAVTSKNQVVLAARATVDTWAWGNAVPGQYVKGQTYPNGRPGALLDASQNFFMKDAPTYAGYANDQIVNVKNAGFDVKGDGRTDDSAALNAILAQNAANCKITYFPYGVYIVLSTLFIPPGSRIVGEAWPVISGAGANFKDANNPIPIVKVGNPNDVGVAQISDMRFTVAEPLAGAKIMEWNIEGSQKGDVGIWNSIVNIGGFRDSTVTSSCGSQDPCQAAHTGVHLTTSSSVYVQNLWVWTADHSEDGSAPLQIISTGRGILVESTKATWLVGSGSEHHWFYGYSFNNAQNVYAGLLQVESPYMQGRGAVQVAPAPWTARNGDPDFSWCAGGDGYCRSSVGINVQNSQNIFLYSSSTWAFFDGTWNGDYGQGNQCGVTDGTFCQANMNRVTGKTSSLSWYGVNTKAGETMILDGQSNPKKLNNPGGWGGILMAYITFA